MSEKLTKNEIIDIAYELLNNSDVRHYISKLGELSALQKFLNAARNHKTEERLSETRKQITDDEFLFLIEKIDISKYTINYIPGLSISEKFELYKEFSKILDVPEDNLTLSIFNKALNLMYKEQNHDQVDTIQNAFFQYFMLIKIYLEAKEFFQ